MSNDIVEFVQQQESMFLERVCDEKVKFSTESQFAIQAFQGNKFLADTARKNMASLQNAIINVASIGISLNPANKHAYLVPRDGKICLDISYMGLLHLAMTTGSIKWGQCKLVHANDAYASNGLDKAPTHTYNPFLNANDRGVVIGGYCTVKTTDGDYLTEEMSLDDIKKIENSSKAKNGPWKTHWNEMARKTVVKRASKYWPKVERLDEAIHNLNTDGNEGLQDNKEPVDITPCFVSQLDEITSQLKRIGRTESQLINQLIPKLLGKQIKELPELTSDEAIKVISSLQGFANA
jgi:recombination protein RecT